MQKFLAHNIPYIAVAGLFSLLLTTSSFGQPSPAEQPTQSSQQTVSDEELRSFARAYVAIEDIRTSHEAELSRTQEPEQAAKIQ